MSFPRYPKYKESGVEWLGEVPEHWDICLLKRAFRSVDYGISDSLASEGSIAILRMGNISNGKVITDDLKYIDSVDPALLLQSGDLLYNRTNSLDLIGKIGLFTGSADVPTSFASYLVRLRTVAESLPAYFAYLLNTEGILGLARANAFVAIGQCNLNPTRYGMITIAVPPKAEQIRIAGFLDQETAKIDDLIAEQQRLIELLKEKRQAVISHAVTKGLNPHAPMKPSGIEWLGDVPAHWSVVALKRVADIRTGVAKGKDNSSRTTITVPYLRVANVQDGYLDLGSVATIEIPESDLERYALKPGDVLMNEGGDFDKLGRGCIWEGQIEPCITQNHVFAVRPRAISSAWLNAITSSDFAQFYFMTRSKQSTNLASISSTNLMELPVIVPPEDEQATLLSFIADQTARCDDLTAEAQRAIDLLQERRTALISAAVTGQIDVRQFVGNEIAA